MEAPRRPLFDFVAAGSDLEELLVLDATVADVANSMLLRKSGMPAALTAALQHVEPDTNRVVAAVRAVMTKVCLLTSSVLHKREQHEPHSNNFLSPSPSMEG
jgi:hypothetical protein